MGFLRGLRPDAVRPEWTGRAVGSILPAVAIAVLCLSGCRSGSSMTAPSWSSMFGGSGKTGEKLASAPPFEGDVAKPSASAKPYPTTTTPEGYQLESARGAGADQATAGTPAAQQEVAPVVYGTAPPPPAVPTPDAYARATPPPAAVGPGPGVDPPVSSIVPQVGPYAASTPAAPAAVAGLDAPSRAEAAAPPAAVAVGSSSPIVEPAAGAPPARMADARASAAWPSNPGTQQGTDRYADQTRYASGSRFSGSGYAAPAGPPSTSPAANPLATPDLPPAPSAAPAAAWPATPAPASPFTGSNPISPAAAQPPVTPAGPMAGPSASPVPDASTPPSTGFDAPANVAPGMTPATSPRRPDPNYRPGGTSSYRRAGQEDGEVQPASFELPPAPAVLP